MEAEGRREDIQGFQPGWSSTGSTIFVNCAGPALTTSCVSSTLSLGVVLRVSAPVVLVYSLYGFRPLRSCFLMSLFYWEVFGSAVCCLQQTAQGCPGPRRLVRGHYSVSLPSKHHVLQGWDEYSTTKLAMGGAQRLTAVLLGCSSPPRDSWRLYVADEVPASAICLLIRSQDHFRFLVAPQ